MSGEALFGDETFEPPQTAINAIIALAGRGDLGLSGHHRSIPDLAGKLAKKHGDDYTSMGRELHDRECFKCWQAYSCAAYKPHTGEQVDEIATFYGDLIRDVVEGRRKLVHKRGVAA